MRIVECETIMSSSEGNLTQIEIMKDEIDYTADLVSMTPFETLGGEVVNFAFMGPKVTHFRDSSGQVSQAKIDLVKLGSVTLSKSAALDFYEAFTILIEGQGWKK